MTELELAAIIGGVATVITYAIGVFAARRFGLPGLARSVEVEQAALIDAQRGRLEVLESRVGELESCQGLLDDARREIGKLERQVSRNHAELVELYRLTGNRNRTARG